MKTLTRIFWICLFAVLLPITAQAASRAEVEQQFRTRLQTDLWPEARGLGVSTDRFNTAFQGITLNWKLPDLVPPGSAPPQRRAQSQAEFRAPSAYFKQANLQSQTRTGR